MSLYQLRYLLLIAVTLFIRHAARTSNFRGIFHQVPEGHVGVYWRNGALLKTISQPGYHIMLPKVTRYEPVQVTLQTDEVRDIPCGTKGGVTIYFEKIEVVNRLKKEYVYETIRNYGVKYDKTWVYDKLHHEVNQFCSKHTLQEVYIDKFDQIDDVLKQAIQQDCDRYAPGIEIIYVRVTKPSIPKSIARNYEQREEERTKVLIAIESQNFVQIEAETQKIKAVTLAEQMKQVSMIRMKQKIMEKESIKKQENIENEIYLQKQKTLADASYYRFMKEAEANQLKLSPEFLELKLYEAIASNPKMFFGEKISDMVFDQRSFDINLSRDIKIGKKNMHEEVTTSKREACEEL